MIEKIEPSDLAGKIRFCHTIFDFHQSEHRNDAAATGRDFKRQCLLEMIQAFDPP